jgi:hypothetical protein
VPGPALSQESCFDFGILMKSRNALRSSLVVCLAILASLPAFAQTVTVSPASLSFGNQAQNTPSSIQKITLKNGQSTAITITSIASNLSDYSQTNTCPISPATLGASKTCTISVTFTPSALGSRPATLTVKDTGTNSPQTVSLSGTGIVAVSVSPTSLSFGSQPVGLKSAALNVTVTNNQNKALVITKISTNLSDYTKTTTCPVSPKTLSAGSSCTVSVFFTPTVSGTRSATLTIADNASNSPTVSLTGTGIIPAVASPTSLIFPGQALGTTSAAQTVTLTNNQSTALSITSISSSLSDFPLSSTCPLSPGTLAAGASCTVSVTFQPKATGKRSGTLSFKDSANNSPQTVSLTGTGTAATLVSIAVGPAPATVALGQTQQFTATGTYTDGTTKNLTSSVTWKSSVPTIASVTAGGLATSLAQGTTNITASSGTKSGTASLSVIPPALASLAVSPANASIPAGTTQQFTATGTYTDGSKQNLTNSVSWSSSSPAIVNVTIIGMATGAGIGSATITASSGTLTGLATLTVGQPALVSIAVTPANPSFALGTTQALKATGTYTDGSTLDLTTSAAWTTTSSGVASVNSQGIATSAAVGSTSVTATSGLTSGSTTLNVTQAMLVSLAVTPAIPSIPLGTSQQFSVTGTFTDGTTQDLTGTVQWNSDNPAVATISNAASTQGLASSVGTGAAKITATAGLVTGSTTLTVTSAVLASIAVTPADSSIALGTKQQFTATGTFTDGSTQDLTSTATWTSDTTTTATVNQAGLATSAGTGTSTISASSGLIAGTGTLTITPAQLVSIAISPQTAAAPVGLPQQFSAIGTYTDGTTQDLTQTAHWSSSVATVATISNSAGTQGSAATLAVGTTTIGVSYGSANASGTLTVNPAALASIAISPTAPAIALGTNQQFAASGTYTDGSIQDVTAVVTWTSSSALISVISNASDSNGLATSSGLGTATITATSGSISASTTLTVSGAALVSITVAPVNSSVPLGGAQQFTATGTYTDGSVQDLTASAVWSSDTPGVASIAAGGLATSASVGVANIMATSGAVKNSTGLTVSSPALVSIAVSPNPASVAAGRTHSFTATGTYTDGSVLNLTNSVTWSSSAPPIANVNGTGLASSFVAGTAIITASSGNIGGSAILTVSPPALVTLGVNPGGASVAAGRSQQFTATGTFTDGSTQDLTNSVSWTSSVPTIAGVNNVGLATSSAPGTAIITARSGSVTNSGTLDITAPALVSIAITPEDPSIPAGTNQQFAATGTYTDNSTKDVTNLVSWSSTAPAIGSISSTGLAMGSGVGNATIIASLNSISGSTSLAVAQPALVSIAVTPAGPSFALGTQESMKATGTYTDGGTQDVTATATWSTSDSAIAMVDNQGNATSVAVGSTTVAAQIGSISGSSVLNVSPAVLVSIAVTPAIPSTALGTTQQFAATGTFTDGSVQDVTQTVQWTSDAQGVATISNTSDKNGLATSVGTGTTTITATSGSLSGGTSLTVTAAVLASIAVTTPNSSIALGTTQQFTATGTFTDGTIVDLTAAATWSSDMDSTVTIDNTGLATTRQVGTVNISATSGNISGSAALTVTEAQLISIAIAPQAASIPLGLTQQLTATGTYTDGTTQDITQSAHWSSTNATVATISNSVGTQGLATTLAVGTTSIGITSGAVSASATLDVNPATLVSIAITPQAPMLPLGTSQQFTASGTYTDGSKQDITSVLNWTSSSALVAVVSNSAGTNGLVTSAGLGPANITATLGTVSSFTTVTVSQASLSSIALTPSGTALALGYVQQFTASATYSDGSTQDITQSSAWSSSVPAVAAISSAGVASASLVGTTQLSATYGSVTGSTSLTVIAPVPVSLSITPVNPSIYIAGNQQFTAVLLYSDGTSLDATSAVTWISSAPGVAAITGSGLATGSTAGSSTMEAMWGTNVITATTTLTVQLPVVTLTPAVASVAISGTQQFAATVTGGNNQTVTWSVDGVPGGSSAAGIGAISVAGLYTAPPTIGIHTITAIAQANSSSSASAALTVGSQAPVAGTFFGLHLHAVSSPIPNSMEGAGRIWDSNAAQWPNLNTANGTFVWSNLDNVLAAYKTAGINDTLYTLWRVPKWASSQPADTTCDYANLGPGFTGECDLPTDLNADGTGTDLIWRTWVQNIAQHVNNPTYLQTHAKISYWEPCNECFRSPILDPGYGGGGAHVAYNGTYPQLVRMMQDARCIIVGNVNDSITALNTTCGQSGYPVIGVDPSAKMVMPSTGLPVVGSKNPPYPQVAQNLLYCTCANNSCSKSSTGCPTHSAGSAAVDIVAVHLYLGTQAPEQIPSQVAVVRSYLSAADLAKPLWNGEGGWGQNLTATQIGNGDPDLEAAWLARFHVMSWASGLQRSYWYEWDNNAVGTLWSPTSIKGCTTSFANGYICSAGTAYQQVHSWLLGSMLTACSVSGTTWTCGLTQSNGSAAEIVWDTSQTCSNGSCSTYPYAAPLGFTKYQDLTGATYSISGMTPVGIKPILLIP